MGHYRQAFREDVFGRVQKGPRERQRDRREGHVPRIEYDALGDGRMFCERCRLPVQHWRAFRCQPR